MKKIIILRFRSALKSALVTAIALTFLLSANQSEAAVDDTFTDANFKYTVLTEEGTTGTVSVAKQSETVPSGAVAIPDSVTNGSVTYSVTSIGYGAFYGCSKLTSITIPDSVTDIEEGAFSSCSSLTTVTIPESVIRIGGWAFQKCSGLTSITIPDSVTSIGYNAFFGCIGLTSITIPDSVTNIKEGAFLGCRNLTNVVIGKNVAYIPANAFRDCTNLKSVIIHSSVIYIDEAAFWATTYGIRADFYFLGPPPELITTGQTSIQRSSKLYYIEGTPGWSSPYWRGYETATWVPDPWILAHPLDQSVTAGAEVILSVDVNASEPLYQWFKDGAAIEGANGPSYGIHDAKVADSGRYSVRVSNELGSVTSQEALLSVNKGTPSLVWHHPQAIVYGTALSEVELNATTDMPGVFMYQPLIGSTLPVGSHILGVIFLPLDTINYGLGFSTVILTVEKATPQITWATPAAISYGTALNGSQLNASADVEGVAAYSPGPGTLLEAGTHTLSLTFTPKDTDNYNAASAQVELLVKEEIEPPALSFEMKAGKLILTYSGGKLEASGDLILWSPVEGVQEGEYEVDASLSDRKFYRVVQ